MAFLTRKDKERGTESLFKRLDGDVYNAKMRELCGKKKDTETKINRWKWISREGTLSIKCTHCTFSSKVCPVPYGLGISYWYQRDLSDLIIRSVTFSFALLLLLLLLFYHLSIYLAALDKVTSRPSFRISATGNDPQRQIGVSSNPWKNPERRSFVKLIFDTVLRENFKD